MKRKAAAIPLITVDPFFSVWDCADTLETGVTKHWSSKECPILAGVMLDDLPFYACGTSCDFTPFKRVLRQTECRVTPLSTYYTFENEHVKLKLCFTTPLLLRKPEILARPASYIRYEIERKTNVHNWVKFFFGINARACVDNRKQDVSFKKTPVSVSMGNTVQNPLSQSGDRVMIDWGYVHVCDTNAKPLIIENSSGVLNFTPLNQVYNAYSDMPYLTTVRKELSGVVTVAYDEVYPIEYFGKPLKEYFAKDGTTFAQMLEKAIAEYDAIKAECDAFDEELMAEALAKGEDFNTVLCFAYRQAIAGHKMVADENGDILFLSKECDSNGCIGTLDVTYPSIPLFLKYNPEFVLGMLRPIIRYAKTDAWTFNFAPHDVGQYPLANGQVYGGNQEKYQMPVEESGNMLLCLGAVYKYSGGDKKLFEENLELMRTWADYLVEFGYDPANQLCTDDFAGHLSHNCNLSLKAILGIACFGMLSGEQKYLDVAQKYAKEWEKDAQNATGATRLTFDDADGWSLKYNIVWDNLLGFNLFSEDVKKAEIELYKTKMNPYGVPLDCRADYTKIDWLMWSTCISEDKEYFEAVCKAMVRMMQDTPNRVPMTDWYYTSTAYEQAFQGRTVVGGLFIPLL
ncbi:MAG: DUF4965 domain-containing protein [Clostridia bacterium]|nr:DUF4965 domain-containing protein [Clostridia bacterium]